MTYSDPLYGEFVIEEPVITALLNTPTLTRLKGIEQGAYRKPFFPGEPPTRYQHSVGVFLVLRKYGATLKEQIAGLIHDASHSAFSHAIDYIHAEGSPSEHSHQDNIHEEYLSQSELPALLNRYGYTLTELLDESQFPLKEQPLPDLCADRIDYSLRDAAAYWKFPLDDIHHILDSLTVHDNKWIFSSPEHALRFAKLFNHSNEYWAGLESAVMFLTVAEYVKHALARAYITPQDLYTTDAEVLNKIAVHHAKDATLIKLFERMNNRVPYRNDPEQGTLTVVKSRAVDPWCFKDGSYTRLSTAIPEWQKTLTKELPPKKWWIAFED
ncbi:MAG: HD domain-containing protein [Patescibacteria group bacterium]|jgi:hypothetical protein